MRPAHHTSRWVRRVAGLCADQRHRVGLADIEGVICLIVGERESKSVRVEGGDDSAAAAGQVVRVT